MLPWNVSGSMKITEKSRTGFFGRLVILADNITRVAIHISVTNDAGVLFLSTDPIVAADRGFRIIAMDHNSFRLTFSNDGPLVQQKWYASSSVATDFTVWETFLFRDPITKESVQGPQTVDPDTGDPINV